MFEQQRLISRVQELCRLDTRLDAALMYGSFAQGEGDAHSDVEFWLFFAMEPGQVQPWAWCNEVAPVIHLVRNEFGAHVAFFSGLIRGEFHFATVDDIATVGAWPARGAPVDRMIVVDRHNRLRPVLDILRRTRWRARCLMTATAAHSKGSPVRNQWRLHRPARAGRRRALGVRVTATSQKPAVANTSWNWTYSHTLAAALRLADNIATPGPRPARPGRHTKPPAVQQP